MEVWSRVEDAQVLGHLKQLMTLGRNLQPALQEVAALGENSTRVRFRTQTGPDGQRWKPSIRAAVTGGRTLTMAGHLSGSISSDAGADYAQWGVNRIYAAIHQFGGVIRAKGGSSLKFPIPGGGFAVVKAVTLPARPFLGVNDDDRDDILNVLTRRISQASGGAAHAA